MLKKIILLMILLSITAFVSGCIDDKTGDNPVNKTETIKSEQIPTVNLPTGFTFMAIHEADVDIGTSSRKAIEGVYRTDTGEDVYIQVFKTDSPEAFMKEYKDTYKDTGYNPFTEIYFNGHKATKVMYQFTSNGRDVEKFNIIWTTKNSMIKVGSSIDAQKVINLATATNT
ncbi:MAG: hypothetical protein WA144_09755 [Candidatus Methanoperedens sp.]